MKLKESKENNNSNIILGPSFAKWWGSDARALACAFRFRGHKIIDIDAEDYVGWRPDATMSKVMRRISGYFNIRNYNQHVRKKSESSVFDFILVFLGHYLEQETLRCLRRRGKPLFNFYPDVSFADHGSRLNNNLAEYDCIFTTKVFHGMREQKMFGIKKLVHVRHGFDPDVHRPIQLSDDLKNHYGCDVSFVGTWSPWKEEKLVNLRKNCPEISLRIHGLYWNRASRDFKRLMEKEIRPAAYGDELAVVYSASKVNLALLSRSVNDQMLEDYTTARTFQIPASGGFMLHEDSTEVRTLFKEDEEMMVFKDDDELAEKIKHVLNNDGMRKAISKKGHQRCLEEPYDYSYSVDKIISYYRENE